MTTHVRLLVSWSVCLSVCLPFAKNGRGDHLTILEFPHGIYLIMFLNTGLIQRSEFIKENKKVRKQEKKKKKKTSTKKAIKKKRKRGRK